MAVYTEVGDEALAAFLAYYDIGTLIAFRGIAEGVENSNFSIRTTQGDYILTLYEKRVDPRDLPYFLALMEHLVESGLPAPRPIRARDDRTLRTLAGRPAAITSFLPGVWPRRVRPEHCAGLGDALARLHLAGADFAGSRANTMGVAFWPSFWEACRGGAAVLGPDAASLLDRIVPALAAGWPDTLPHGQIHADLFPDNVFFLNGAVSGLIDFYFACTDFLAYDVAVCLNAWCFEPDFSFNVTKARALLRAYDGRRPLSAPEREALPVLARGAALRFLLTRLHDWAATPPGALVVRKDPGEYWRKLRFHLAVETWSEYGV